LMRKGNAITGVAPRRLAVDFKREKIFLSETHKDELKRDIPPRPEVK